jgi:hypothetical protein
VKAWSSNLSATPIPLMCCRLYGEVCCNYACRSCADRMPRQVARLAGGYQPLQPTLATRLIPRLYALARIKPGEYATARLNYLQPAAFEWPRVNIPGHSKREKGRGLATRGAPAVLLCGRADFLRDAPGDIVKTRRGGSSNIHTAGSRFVSREHATNGCRPCRKPPEG